MILVFLTETMQYHDILTFLCLCVSYMRSVQAAENVSSMENTRIDSYTDNETTWTRLDLYPLQQRLQLQFASRQDQCSEDVRRFSNDMVIGENYALQALGAFGEMPKVSSLMPIQHLWFGSYDKCTSLRKRSGQWRYCLLQGQPQHQHPVGQVFIAVCAPASCHDDQLHSYGQTGENPDRMNPWANVGPTGTMPDCYWLDDNCHYDLEVLSYIHDTNFTTNHHICSTERPFSTGDWVALSVCTLFLLLVVIGTCIDIYQRKTTIHCDYNIPDAYDTKRPPPVYSSYGILLGTAGGHTATSHLPCTDELYDASGTVHGDKNTCKATLINLLRSFSALINIKKIVLAKPPLPELATLNGMRVLSLWWVILGHTYYYIQPFVADYTDGLHFFRRISFQLISNFSFSVDTFFFMSGLLVSYTTITKLKKCTGNFSWSQLLFHRWWRLTPTYMFVLMLWCTLYLHVVDGPIKYSLEASPFVTGCYDHWWANLLYLSNFLPKDHLETECMPWTWFLANDMQFYIISPIFIYLLYRNWRVGVAVVITVLFGSITLSGSLATHYKSGPIVLGPTGAGEDTGSYDLYLYVRPYHRIAPHLVGILTGCLLNACKRKVRLPKICVLFCWLLSVIVAGFCMFGLYSSPTGGIDNVHVQSLYVSVSRVSWALVLAWLVVACMSGYGGIVTTFLSWNVWTSLGKLGFSAYLLHPLVLYLNYIALRSPAVVTDTFAIWMFVGNTVITYLVAFVLSAVVEMPLLECETVLLKMNRKPQQVYV